MTNKNRISVDTLFSEAIQNSALTEQKYAGYKISCRIKNINSYNSVDDTYKIDVHTNQIIQEDATYYTYLTVFLKGHENIKNLKVDNFIDISCDKITCLSRNKTIYIRVNTSCIDDNPHIDQEQFEIDIISGSQELLNDDGINQSTIALTTLEKSPGYEKTRLNVLFDEIRESLEDEIASARQKRLTEIDTESAQQKCGNRPI